MNSKLLPLVILAASAALGQNTSEKIKATFRDPSRPGTIKMSLIHGGITVKGYSGQEVLIEATPRRRDEQSDAKSEAPAGLKRIYAPSSSLNVEEENNVMRIEVGSHRQAMDVTLQVPLKTSLNLSTINGGAMIVENVQGDLEVNNTNGAITLTNVAGSVVAHALNGAITASIREADPAKPMSFSSLNGKIDVTLPANMKANLNLQSARGEVYSDFDVTLTPTEPKVEETKREDGRGRYRIRTGHGMIGKVNGGGQEVTFKSMNGSIYIRKAK
jgi:DUF4097 and DUF4098 domain-containing protein YvlB